MGRSPQTQTALDRGRVTFDFIVTSSSLTSAPADARARSTQCGRRALPQRAACRAHADFDVPQRRGGIAPHRGAPCAERSAHEMRSGDIHRQVPAVSGAHTSPQTAKSFVLAEHAFVLVRVLVRSIYGLALLPSPPPY